MEKTKFSIYLLFFISLTHLNTSKADLLLIGGGLSDNNTEVIGRFITISGGKGVAKIGSITTASADPLDSFLYYEELFLAYGAASVTFINVTETSNNADSPEIVALIKEQTGYFFGGGDQARVTAGWKRPDGTDTLGLQAMREIFDNGGAVGGSSAGASCHNTGPMIDGGLSWNALKDGAFTVYDPNYDDALFYIEDGGLGFLPGYLIDTHSSERGREGRMIELLLDTNLKFAILADEDTGVQIDSNGDAEVLGNAGGILIIDLTEAVRTASTPTKVNGVRLSFFTEDDKFNIYDGSVTFAPWKSNIKGAEYYIESSSSNNIFSSPYKLLRQYSVFRKTARRLWDSLDNNVTSYSFESNPQFIVTMYKSDGVGYGGYSPIDNYFQVSYNKMVVDIDFTN